jgi:hypothetical protein
MTAAILDPSERDRAASASHSCGCAITRALAFPWRRQGAADRPSGVTTSQSPPNPWMLWHFTSFFASWA